MNTPERSQPLAYRAHQAASRPLADGRTLAEQLHDGIRTLARRLIFSTPAASDGDRQFLHDLAREEVRYPMRALERLIAIARTSARPADREAPAELVRRLVRNATAAPGSVTSAADLETEAQGPADVATRAFEQRPNRATKERAEETLAAHMATLRDLLDAVEATPV